jgi:hypothetical protein
MPERTLEILIGALRLGLAAALTLATARRCAPLLAPGRPPASERLLATALAAGLLVTWSVAALGFAGALSARALVLAALALYLASLGLARGPAGPALLPLRGPRVRLFVWPLLLSAPIACADLLVQLPLPPTDWDALTYHLYLPARWLQEQQLFHVPTVFGDNAAAFAPQNGALLFTWLIGLFGGDALTNCSALLAAIVLAVALYRIGVGWGVARETAALVAAAVFWLPPLRHWTYTATVDVWMLAWWLLAVHWLLASFDPRGRSAVLACGLAAGFAAGTKTIGLALVAAPALLLVAVLLARRSYGRILVFAAALLAAGGWWYLRNGWLYANPLFPLELSLGPLPIAAGAYEFAAVAGQFYGGDKLAVAGLVLRTWGTTTGLLTAAGLAGLLFSAVRRRTGRRGAAVALALSLYWGWFYFWRLPHNTETRFLLPLLLLSLLGCMLLLEPLHRRSRVLARGIWTGVLLAAAGRPVDAWRTSLANLADSGTHVGVWLGLGLAACLCLAAAARTRRAGARRLAGAGAAVIAGAALVVAQIEAERSRDTVFERSRFGRWAEAYRFVAERDSPAPLRIAYTGLNLPYPLMGAGLEHRVAYCNTQGRAGDGFYEFWQRDPGPHPRYKPGLYRGADDYAVWLGHLTASRIEWLVIFALHPQERRYLWSTPEGFPIERVWARQHPERFERVFSGRSSEIYRLRPQNRSAPS